MENKSNLISESVGPTNFENYGPYEELARTGKITVYTSFIDSINYDSHFNGIMNILKDSIETEFTQNMFITVHFDNNEEIDLTITDYFFNLIMWYLIIRAGDHIQPKHIFLDQSITKKGIKHYIDELFIDCNRKKIPNVELNNIIDDALSKFNTLDQFSMYFANTINVEDTITLMNKDPRFFEAVHADLSTTPIEDVKSKGMEYTNFAIDRMKNAKDALGYDHCLANPWRASEGINPKQFKEFSINIGSKPDGQGGVFPAIINTSFLTGGVASPTSYFIESSSGRTAQIMSKMNVGYSGHFARLLGLNNMDTILHPDPDYVCNTKNFIKLTIKNENILHKVNNRYYRTNPNGVDKLLRSSIDKHLIGQTIYLRSPITCASASHGHGICYRCYGDLAYANKDIDIGRIAAEELSSKLTQILLSAKHLLETAIKRLNWMKEFYDIFEVDANIIKLIPETNFKGWKMIIDPENIQLENEDDYSREDSDDDISPDSTLYNEAITEFIIEKPDGEQILIHTEDFDNMYISNDLNNIIRKKAEPLDDHLCIHLNDLKDIAVFYMIIQNNELSKTLNKLKDILNKKAIITTLNKDSFVQDIIGIIMDGGLDVSSVHMEVIIGNQIRDADDILEKPKWEYPDAAYEIISLNRSLSCNPSITVTLSFQDLSRLLYNPLTFRKHKASFMDLFFMESPQRYLDPNSLIATVEESDKEENVIIPGYIEERVDEPDEDELD